MKLERLPEIISALPTLGLERAQVVAFQEVNIDPIHYLKAGSRTDQWTVVAAKKEGEWRGRATAAVRSSAGIIKHRHRQAEENGLEAMWGSSMSTSLHPERDR